MLECTRIAAPQREEAGFHVEQTPVEQPAPGFATPRDQHMAAWLEGDHGQGRAQIPQVGDVAPVEPALPGLAAMPHPGPACALRRRLLPIRRRLRPPAAPVPTRPSRTRPRKLRPYAIRCRASSTLVLPAPLSPVSRFSPGPGRRLTRSKRRRPAISSRVMRINDDACKAERPGDAGRSRSTWNKLPVTAGVASPHAGTSRCWPRGPGPRSWRRATAGPRARRAGRRGHRAGN